MAQVFIEYYTEWLNFFGHSVFVGDRIRYFSRSPVDKSTRLPTLKLQFQFCTRKSLNLQFLMSLMNFLDPNAIAICHPGVHRAGSRKDVRIT